MSDVADSTWQFSAWFLVRLWLPWAIDALVSPKLCLVRVTSSLIEHECVKQAVVGFNLCLAPQSGDHLSISFIQTHSLRFNPSILLQPVFVLSFLFFPSRRRSMPRRRCQSLNVPLGCSSSQGTTPSVCEMAPTQREVAFTS